MQQPRRERIDKSAPNNVSLTYLFQWLSEVTKKDVKGLGDLLSGEIYCLVVSKAWPSSLKECKVKQGSGRGFDKELNFKLLDTVLRKLFKEDAPPVVELANGKYSEHVHFARWLKRACDADSAQKQDSAPCLPVRSSNDNLVQCSASGGAAEAASNSSQETSGVDDAARSDGNSCEADSEQKQDSAPCLPVHSSNESDECSASGGAAEAASNSSQETSGVDDAARSDGNSCEADSEQKQDSAPCLPVHSSNESDECSASGGAAEAASNSSQETSDILPLLRRFVEAKKKSDKKTVHRRRKRKPLAGLVPYLVCMVSFEC
ncbi:hypothetical protein V5799_026479 [Amblyomma americanum]|uniref:Calponin-homology (CH) domain-containing protein n=1 Tax=Amblyomma americanum TaxID=6943 RepID=A0AAQ4DIG5_AMBAM